MWLSACLSLISQVMKVLRDGSCPRRGRRFLDPLQVAFHPHLGSNDAAINAAICIWVSLCITVRITFLQSHSTFNTIPLLPLGEKLCGQCNDLLDQRLPHRQATGCLSGQCDSVLSDVVVNELYCFHSSSVYTPLREEDASTATLNQREGDGGIWTATNTYEWW